MSRPRIDMLKSFNEFTKALPTLNAQFNAAADLNAWTAQIGSWQLVSGSYTARMSSGSEWAVSKATYCVSRFQAEVRMRRIDPDTSTDWNSGLILRSRNYADKSTVGYWFAYSKGGTAVVWRLNDYNVGTGPDEDAQQLCQQSAPVSSGAFNTLKIVADSTAYRLFVNGTQVCTVNDSALTFGGVNVAMAGPNGDSSHRLDVDWLKLTPVTGTAPLVASDAIAATTQLVAAAASRGTATVRGTIR